MFDTTVYMADAGNGTYGVFDPAGDFSDPTSLDDHLLSNASGRLWQNMTFGVNITSSRVFICRWLVYDNHVPNNTHDTTAFTGLIADFGVRLATNPPFYTNPYAAGAWAFTIDISPQPIVGWGGVSCPDDSIFMAQQFRFPHNGPGGSEDGEGPFDTAQFNLWNVAAAPSIGSSDNSFYFDWDPQNGTYAEDELETFEAPNLANLLRVITTSGTLETVNPGSGSVFGDDIQGSQWLDLYDNDDSYISFKPRYDVARTDPNGIVTVLGQMSGSSSVTRFTFTCEAAASLPDGTQSIDLWNWTTGVWDNVDNRAISSTDTTVAVTISSNVSRYINSLKRLQSRIRFFPPTNIDRSYRMRVDKMNWSVLHP